MLSANSPNAKLEGFEAPSRYLVCQGRPFEFFPVNENDGCIINALIYVREKVTNVWN